MIQHNNTNIQTTLNKGTFLTKVKSLFFLPTPQDIIVKAFLNWFKCILNASQSRQSGDYGQALGVDILVNHFVNQYRELIKSYKIEPNTHNIQQLILGHEAARNFLVDQGVLDECWHSSQITI